MDWQDIAKGFIAPPEDLQQLLNIQHYTMKVVFEMNLSALLVSVRFSLGDLHRWQRKRYENTRLCVWILLSADLEQRGQTLAQK